MTKIENIKGTREITRWIIRMVEGLQGEVMSNEES